MNQKIDVKQRLEHSENNYLREKIQLKDYLDDDLFDYLITIIIPRDYISFPFAVKNLAVYLAKFTRMKYF